MKLIKRVITSGIMNASNSVVIVWLLCGADEEKVEEFKLVEKYI